MRNASPLYKQMAVQIQNEIKKTNLNEGDAILSEAKLADKYQVSRVTIRKAIDTLVEQGILYRVRGSGTFVSPPKIKHDIYHLQGFTEEMLSLNEQPRNIILDFRMELPPAKIQNILELGNEEKVFFVKRLRCVENEPRVLEETYLPVIMFPDLSVEIMEKSKYEYIEQRYTIDERRGEIIPMRPNAYLKNTLSITEDMSILSMNTWSYLEDRRVFEYTELYFRSDKYTFMFSSKRP